MAAPPKPPLKPSLAKQTTAVALDSSKGGPTRVVASGRGALAEAILAVAFEHGVKVREDADLVELLAAVDVDSPIPLEAPVMRIVLAIGQSGVAGKPIRPAP